MILRDQENLWGDVRVDTGGGGGGVEDLRARLLVSRDAVSVIQACIELAEARQEIVLSNADIHQRETVINLITDINTRTTQLLHNINTQLRRLSGRTELSDSLDGVICWLNDTEGIINDQIHVANKQQMQQLLMSVKKKESDSFEKKLLLESVMRGVVSENLEGRPEQLNDVRHDSNVTADRWNKLVPMLSTKRHLLNEKLSRLDRLMIELKKLTQLIPVVKHQMERLQPHLPTTDPGLIQDIQVIYNVLESGETDMRTLRKLYTSLETECNRDKTEISVDLIHQMSDVRAEWTIIHSLALVLRASLEPAVITSTDTSKDEVVQKTSISQTQACLPVTPQATTKHPELTLLLASVDNAEHLSLLDTSSHQVLVGSIKDIEDSITRGRTLVDDLEKKIVTAHSMCLSLLNKSKSDKEKTFLKDTIEELEARKDGARLKQTRRSLELEDMLVESRQLDQMSGEFNRWIESVEEDFSSQQIDAAAGQLRGAAVITMTQHITAVEELLQTCKNLESESRPWQSKVSAVRSVCDSMKGRYSNDDVTQLNNVIGQTERRWAELQNRLTSQSKLLQNRLNSIRRFDTEVKDIKFWLTGLDIELGQPRNLDNINQSRVEEIRQELDLERRKLAAVNAAGEQLIRECKQSSAAVTAGPSSAGQLQTAVRAELDQLNHSWNLLTDSVPQLMRIPKKPQSTSSGRNSSAAMSSDKAAAVAAVSLADISSAQLLKLLLELNDWLMGVSSELNSRHSPGGSNYSLQYQLDTNTAIRRRLDQKQTEIDEATKIAKSFLKDVNSKSTNHSSAQQDLQDEAPSLSVDIKQAEERERLRKVETSAERLEKNWSDVNSKCDEWRNQIKETMELVRSFELVIEETSHSLEPLERVIPTWSDLNTVQSDHLQREYNQAKTFHSQVISMKQDVDRCRSATAGFGVRDESFELPESCIKKLDEINSRWLALESSVEGRLDRLVKALKEAGPSSQYQLSMTVFPPWERALADSNKVPYFINHSSESTQWDHPEMSRAQQALAELNTVKFSAYRTSMKIRLLQKRLSLDLISIEKFTELLESSNLTTYNERMLSVTDLITMLTSLFEEAQTRHDKLNIPLSIDLTLNWLLNLYDPTRSGQIKSLSFKVAIIVMCRISLEEKYKALYHTVSNASGRVDEHRLGLLLYDCVMIPRQLGEVAAFGGSNIDSSVKSCFQSISSGGTSLNPQATPIDPVAKPLSPCSAELDEVSFCDWMRLEPQSMVWLPVLHRLTAAESARHQTRCKVCREYPIVGFRYRCLKCFNFDLCQTCFFSGRKSKGHKLTHPMQEYCTTTTSGENVRDFTQTFKNKFRSKQYFQRHPRLGYLPVETVLDGTSVKMDLPPLDLSETEQTPPTYPNKNGSSAAPNKTGSSDFTSDQNSTGSEGQTNGRVSPSMSFMTRPKGTTDVHHKTSRASEAERKKRESTPDWEDEHNLIAQYCYSLSGSRSHYSLMSPMQIMMAIDAEQKAELETMIKDLEEENRVLQVEYDNLRIMQKQQRQQLTSSLTAATSQQPQQSSSKDAEMIAEAKLLRQHKGKLEARMTILEDHNRQLDAQLKRLKQLLAQEQLVTDTRIVTYPYTDPSTDTNNVTDRPSSNSLPRRVPPAFKSNTTPSATTTPTSATTITAATTSASQTERTRPTTTTATTTTTTTNDKNSTTAQRS